MGWSKCLQMCYTSRDITMSGWWRRKPLAAYMWGGRFLSCTGGIFLNALWWEGRMEQSSVKLQRGSCQFIAVAAHTLAWYNRIDTKCHENVKLCLQRQQAQRKKQNQQHHSRLGKSASALKCKWYGEHVQRSMLWVNNKGWYGFFHISNLIFMTAVGFLWQTVQIYKAFSHQ